MRAWIGLLVVACGSSDGSALAGFGGYGAPDVAPDVDAGATAPSAGGATGGVTSTGGVTGCTTDTECKGVRVCEAGRCVTPMPTDAGAGTGGSGPRRQCPAPYEWSPLWDACVRTIDAGASTGGAASVGAGGATGGVTSTGGVTGTGVVPDDGGVNTCNRSDVSRCAAAMATMNCFVCCTSAGMCGCGIHFGGDCVAL